MARDLTGRHHLYYEATLQLREVSQEIIDFAEAEIIRTKLYVAKKIKLKNGYDYLLSDNELTKALGKRLKTKFGGDLKLTSSLFSQKDGKEIFRGTVLFRGIPFKKNDLVEYQGEKYKVKLLSKDIFLQNEKTGQKIHVKYKNMEEIKLASS